MPVSRHVTIPPEHCDPATWPQADVSHRSEEDQALFERRCQAVIAYVTTSTPAGVIGRRFGFSGGDLAALVRRALTVIEDNRIAGFRGLVPHGRLQEYRRHRELSATAGRGGGSRAGIFQQFLDAYPEIRQLINNGVLRIGNGLSAQQSRVRVRDLHGEMLEACRDRGLGEEDYPLNTHDRGLRSLSTYVRSLIDQDPVRFARARFGADAARSMRREPHKSRPDRPKRALERLELDEHTIDLGISLRLRLADGTSKALPTSRIHLIAMHDVFCNAALGYYVSFRPQATAFDIQRCVVRALRSPMGAGVPEGASSPGGDDSRCVPVDWLPDFQWCAWDELLLDRAWSHLANDTVDTLTAKIGSIARFDARRTPEQRGAIEALFKGIADEIHQLPGTTGSSPKDPLRYAHTGSEPLIYTDDVNEIVIRLIREHNLAVSRSRGHRAPFTVFEESLRVHGPPRTVPPNLRKVERVLGFRINATVRSQAQSGRRPYVQYKNVHYTNALLANHFGLTGKRMTLLVNPDDLRSVEAFLPNGHELGPLTATGLWGRVPHTLEDRDLFFAGVTPNERQALTSGKGAAVRDAMKRLSDKAQSGRRDAARLAAFHNTTGSQELDAPESNDSESQKLESPPPEQSRRARKKKKKGGRTQSHPRRTLLD